MADDTYHRNPATGNWDDTYYAEKGRFIEAAANGTSINGGGSSEDYLQKAIDAMTSKIKKIKPYDEVNPFSFDETLAREAATAEYAPYYDETLSDYVANVEKKLSRSVADRDTTLEQLNAGKEYYTGAERRALDKSIRSTNEGYAGRGLFFSGVRPRDVQELQTESNAKVGNYMSGYNYNVGQTNLAQKRTAEDLATAQSQYTRDINREKQYGIETGIANRKSEATNEYNLKRQQYYDTQNYIS
jgi:hypothetical protein